MTTKWLSGWAAICRSIHSATARRSSARATSSRPSSRTRHRPRSSWRSHQPPGSLPGRVADRGPDHIGQRDRRVGDDRLGPLAQREQDRDPPAARVPAAEVTPHRGRPLRRAAWASSVLLPLPGCPTSARTTRARRSSSSSIVCRGRGVLGRSVSVSPGRLLRGPADQRDVDVDVAQFRDVVAAGREILHVDVPERVKHPPPVPVAVPGNGRRLHHVSPPHLRHPALR